MKTQVYDVVLDLIKKIYDTQDENIEKAARAMATCFENGGLLQAYGGGHSSAAAMELCARAGGFAPTKRLKEYSEGIYEDIEGNGTLFMHNVDVRKGDIVFVISNSGRNPMPIEIAIEAKKRKAVVVALTSMDTTKQVTSRHSGGKNLYEYADIILDNCVDFGDTMISLKGLDTKICAMSAITNDIIIQEMCCRATKMMIDDGYEPPISKSKNIDGGQEYNLKLHNMYFDRVYHQ